RNRLRTGEREREQRVDLLKYQIDEIAAAMLEAEEDERIANERAILANAERLVEDASAALQALERDDDDAGAAAMLRSEWQHVQRIAEVDVSTVELVERVNEVVVLADDVASDLRRYVESVDADTARLASVDQRFDLIVQLKHTYAATIADIQVHLEAAQTDVEMLTGAGFDEEALAEQEA